MSDTARLGVGLIMMGLGWFIPRVLVVTGGVLGILQIVKITPNIILIPAAIIVTPYFFVKYYWFM